MFFIAGIQPKTKRLDQPLKRCLMCGRYQAFTQRTDHYLSLFFIPLLKVKTGPETLYCPNCQSPVADAAPPRPTRIESPTTCSACGKPLQADFKYCPNCGSPTNC